MPEYDGLLALDRFERAVEKVRQRLLRVTGLLEAAGIPYAVVGGNAVMAWVEQADESIVRPTQDVDLAIHRQDFERVKTVLEPAGFIYRHVKSIDMFLDGPDAKARDAVHLIFSGEKVRPDSIASVPDISGAVSFKTYRVIDLQSLVTMKLTSNRRKDQVHLLDMIEAKLIDATWPTRFEPELARRLQDLLDNPDS